MTVLQREVKYLSPTSIKTWEEDKESFYLKYVSGNRPPRDPQTQPMAAGSAFDAFVKSYLYKQLTGCVSCGEYDFDILFETQVEPQNWDFGLKAGRECFDHYQKCGALSDLLLEIDRVANGIPVFETTVRGEVGGVPLLGKPDIHFTMAGGHCAIYDWKVNGYCAAKPPSPKKYYIRSYAGGVPAGGHKEFEPMPHVSGLVVDSHGLEEVFPDWAMQVSIYQWLCGAPVGSGFVVGIDQLCGANRVACFRSTVGATYQHDLYNRVQRVWASCQCGLSDCLSDERREILDTVTCGGFDSFEQQLSER